MEDFEYGSHFMVLATGRIVGMIGDTEYWFSGDCISHSFSRWPKYQHIITQIDPKIIADLKHLGYTIGGNIIFPANVPKG